jgi:Fe-S-cluster-containing dehydrogenase component
MKVRFDEELCVGCYACHVACIAAHHLPEEEDVQSFRTTKKVINEAAGVQRNVCPGCVHCGMCMRACPNGAIYKEETYGLILVDKSLCVGCKTCSNVCPKQVILYDQDGKMEKCDGCIERLQMGREQACVRACCVHAIEMA